MKDNDLEYRCKYSDVTDDTKFIWFEQLYGFAPLCGGVIGEWSWNSNLSILYNYFKRFILYSLTESLCGHKEYATKDNSIIKIMELYESDYDSDIIDKNAYGDLKALVSNLEDDITFPEFGKLIKDISDLLNKLGVKAYIKLFKNPNDALMLVKEHGFNHRNLDLKEVFQQDIVG